MRIISPFKDYYDPAQAYGIDPKLNYYRQPKIVEKVRLQDYFSIPDIDSQLGYWNVEIARTGLLIVCGKLYPFLVQSEVLEFNKCRDSYVHLSSTLPLSRSDPRIIGDGVERPIADKDYWLEVVNEYFDELDAVRGYEVGPAIHREVGAPIILTGFFRPYWQSGAIEPVQILTNPRLANFGFQTILDPFTCFQEIAQYLGNELAQPDIAPLRTGDDETILRAKGFDEQSFRTAAPGHKKLNRKVNRARKKKPD